MTDSCGRHLWARAGVLGSEEQGLRGDKDCAQRAEVQGCGDDRGAARLLPQPFKGPLCAHLAWRCERKGARREAVHVVCGSWRCSTHWSGMTRRDAITASACVSGLTTAGMSAWCLRSWASVCTTSCGRTRTAPSRQPWCAPHAASSERVCPRGIKSLPSGAAGWLKSGVGQSGHAHWCRCERLGGSCWRR